MQTAPAENPAARMANDVLSRLPCVQCLHFAAEALGMSGGAPCPVRAAALAVDPNDIGQAIFRDSLAFCTMFEPD
jgi:hypothetical protein